MCIEDRVVCKWYQPHRWGKWEVYRYGVLGIFQKRTCSRCGKVEMDYTV